MISTRSTFRIAAVALSLTGIAGNAAAQSIGPEGDLSKPATPPADLSTVQPAQVAPPAAAAATPPAAAKEETPPFKITPLGYVEAYYAYNFNRPANGLTNFRGFDNRHNTFSLSNVALGASFEGGPITGKLVLQVGSTPSTYYMGEPALSGSSGANATSSDLWKYLQEAHVGYKAPVGRGLLLELGLFPSPCGFESIPVKDNWNWSRSNLFFGFPFYHAGLRATYEWTDKLSSAVWVMNGWNSVVDNNEEKSFIASTAFKLPDKLNVQALYMGGIERTTGSPEGPYWRHHFDLIGQYDATTWLSLAAQLDYGWEPNRIGTASWAAGALYVRVKPIDRFYIALRGDRFHENLATGNGASSAPIFWGGVEWVTSGTVTLDVRPHDQLSIRLEYRHDAAAAPLYFAGNVQGNGSAATPYLANARTQDTVLLGATAWF